MRVYVTLISYVNVAFLTLTFWEKQIRDYQLIENFRCAGNISRLGQHVTNACDMGYLQLNFDLSNFQTKIGSRNWEL